MDERGQSLLDYLGFFGYIRSTVCQTVFWKNSLHPAGGKRWFIYRQKKGWHVLRSFYKALNTPCKIILSN